MSYVFLVSNITYCVCFLTNMFTSLDDMEFNKYLSKMSPGDAPLTT